ncbi:CotH kinase family protein [Cytobacillus purgationiresistens]|uniref:Spore coat protein H n=1 Tax=Cytobacillus purgationiresistens TaxID=863449 RepID=A0ABU0ACH1_9BACI|nr:CotH kinase family protein [Cytobacillus purgationiresistens]MDQ0268951.1 spore coat protein H [Cytobacillus purgationiresistens]
MGGSELSTYKVFIQPQDFSFLKSDIWSEEKVPGYVTIQNKKLDIDIGFRGSHIRKIKKKSYQIEFYKPKLWKGAKEIHLNAEYNDPSMIRNKLSYDFFSSIGVLTPSAEHVFITLNGKKEGVYLQLESVDEYYFKKRGLPVRAIFYAVDGDANFSLFSDLDKESKKSLTLGYELKYGDEEEELFLQEFIYKLNTLLRDEFEKEIIRYLDVEKYLLWLAGAVCTQNYDGFVHNYALYRNGETGLFEILPWDYDATWGRDINGKSMDYNYVRMEGFNTLSARILGIPAFRNKYYRILNELLDDRFNVETIRPQINALYSKLRPYFGKDPYKKDKIEDFEKEPDFICRFIEDRNSYLRAELKKLGQ